MHSKVMFFLLGRISITVRDDEVLLTVDWGLVLDREIWPGIPLWFGLLVPGPRPIWGRFMVKKNSAEDRLV